MGILDKLTTGGSPLSRNNGAQPTNIAVPANSTLHNQYSINGTPNQVGKPAPSILDLDGQIPSWNYRDNAPEGKSF